MPNVNTGTKKSNKLLIISILVLVVAILVPATLAWFTDQTDHMSTVTFGMIKIDDKSGYDQTQTVNALPGQSFAGAEDCSVALAEGSEPVFIRASIVASFTNLTASKEKVAVDGSTVSVPYAVINAAMDEFVVSLNNLLANKVKTTIADGYGWTKYNGFYYLVTSGTGENGVPLKVTTTATTYLFVKKTDMVIPVELTNPSADVSTGEGTIKVKNLQFGEVVNIKLIFEGVQAENLASASGAPVTYNPDAPIVKAIEQFFDSSATPNQTLPTT